MKKLLYILILLLFSYLVFSETSSSTINWLSKNRADTIYGQLGGNNIWTGNNSFTGHTFNINVTNYNVTGQINATKIYLTEWLNASDGKIRDSLIVEGNTTSKELYLTLDAQDYRIRQRANALSIQAQDSGQRADFELYTKDGDGTDTIALNFFDLGTPEDITNREAIQLQKDSTKGLIRTLGVGTGTVRPMHMTAGVDYPNQIVAGDDNNVGIGKIPSNTGYLEVAYTSIFEDDIYLLDDNIGIIFGDGIDTKDEFDGSQRKSYPLTGSPDYNFSGYGNYLFMDGNVGINSTSSNLKARFQVNEKNNFQGRDGSSTAVIWGTVNITGDSNLDVPLSIMDSSSSYATGIGGAIGFGGAYADYRYNQVGSAIQGIRESSTQYADDWGLAFYTSYDNNVLNEVVRMDKSGNTILKTGSLIVQQDTNGLKLGALPDAHLYFDSTDLQLDELGGSMDFNINMDTNINSELNVTENLYVGPGKVEIKGSASEDTLLKVDAETNDYTGTATNYNIYSDRKIITSASSSVVNSYGIYNEIDQGHVMNGVPFIDTPQTFGIRNDVNVNPAHSATPIIALVEENFGVHTTLDRIGTITGGSIHAYSNYGSISLVTESLDADNAGLSLSTNNYGYATTISASGSEVSGSKVIDNKAFQAIILDGADAGIPVTSYGFYAGGIGGDTAYAFFNGGSADNRLGGDNVQTCSGNADDACWYYDNQDMILSPNNVGSGQVVIEDNNNFDSGLGIGFDRENVRFNIEGQGSEDTSTDTANNAWIDYWVQPTDTITGVKTGIQNIIRWYSDYNSTSDVRLSNNVAGFDNSATGNISIFYHNMERLNQDSDSMKGFIEDYYMEYILVSGENNIDIRNWHGYYHDSIDFTGDSNIGIEIGNITGATENIAIKTGLGNVEFGDDTLIKGDLNVTQNITGNQIYGGMHYHNHSGRALSFDIADYNYTLFMEDVDFINGFKANNIGYGLNSSLTAQVNGVYQAIYTATGDGENNDVYRTSVFVNEDYIESCDSHKKMASGGDITSMNGNCFLRLEIGNNVSLRVANEGGTGSGTYYGGNLNLVRVGD